MAVAWKGRPGPPAANVMGMDTFPLDIPSNVMVLQPGSLVRNAGALMAVKVAADKTPGSRCWSAAPTGVSKFVSKTSESASAALVKKGRCPRSLGVSSAGNFDQCRGPEFRRQPERF